MVFASIKSLVRHTAIYSIGDVFAKGLPFLLVFIYARKLTAEDNGIISVAFAFIGFSAVFYSLGINQALIRYLSGQDDPAARRERFSTAFWTLFTVGLILSGALVAWAGPLSRILWESRVPSLVFYLMAAVIFLDALNEPLFTVCRARQRSGTYAGVKLAQHTLQMGLTAYLILGRGQGAMAVFWANLGSSAFAFLALSPVWWRNLRPTYVLTAARELLSFGLPFVPSAFAAMIVSLSDKFLVRFYLGLDDAGIYGVTYKLGVPMLLVVRAFRSAWAPAVLSESDTDEGRRLCTRVASYFTVTAVFMALCISAFAPELIALVAGANAPIYLPGRHVVSVVNLAFLFYGFYVILTAGVYVGTRTGMLPAIVGAGAALNILLNILLIPRIGFIAAAWSTVAAYVLMAVLLYLSTRRFYPVAFEYGRLAKVAVAGVVVYIATSGYVHDTTAAGVAARAIFLLGYPVILWGWRFVSPQEWHELQSMFQLPRHRAET